MNYTKLVINSLILVLAVFTISSCSENKAQKEEKILKSACEQFDKSFIESCNKSFPEKCIEVVMKSNKNKLTREQITQVCADSGKIQCNNLAIQLKPTQCKSPGAQTAKK
jgi:hypothetical protein